MAQKVMVQMVDDLDGSEASETLSFGLDGYTYEIDLNEKNASKLRKQLEPFAGAARRVGKAARRTTKASTSDAPAIREWARNAGLDVPSRGAIPKSVREAYAAAH